MSTMRRSAKSFCSGIAVRIGRTVAALQPDLMRSVTFGPRQEELLIERKAAVGSGIQFDHPAVNALGIELRIDRAVKRVREVDALAVAADFDHLRTAIERAVRCAGMRRARHDAANPHFSRQFRREWVGYVVLQQVTRSPAGHI